MPLTKIEGPSLGNVTISSITSNASFDSGTLFVDATNNRVGIGNTAPTHTLRIEGTTSVSGAVNALSTLGVTGIFTALANSTLTGAVTMSNTVSITGAANALSTLGVTGIFTASANSSYVGAATFSNTVSITGATNALSTLGVTGTLSALGQFSVTGNATFDTSTLFVDATNDRVGVGTTSPAYPFDVTKAGGGNFVGYFKNTSNGTPYTLRVQEPASPISGYPLFDVVNSAGTTAYFLVHSGTGNIGIGTSSPSSILHLRGSAPTLTLDDSGSTTTAISFRPAAASYAERGRLALDIANAEMRLAVGVSGTTYFQTFYTNGTERMRITSDGNVGIGVTPSYRLDITGSAGSVVARFNQATAGKTGVFFAENGTQRAFLSQVGLYSGTSDGNFGIFVETGYNFQIATNGSVTSKFTVHTGGDIAIGATAKLYLDGTAGTGDSYLSEAGANVIRVTVGGVSAVQWDTTGMYLNTAPPTSASAANAVVGSGSDYLRRSTSSLLYKHDIATLDTTDALSAVMAMRPVTYRGKTDEDQRRFVGFIAEEMQEIAPLLCTYDEGGESGTPNYVTYDRVTAYLVAVVQQQQNEINALKARLATLEA